MNVVAGCRRNRKKKQDCGQRAKLGGELQVEFNELLNACICQERIDKKNNVSENGQNLVTETTWEGKAWGSHHRFQGSESRNPKVQ